MIGRKSLEALRRQVRTEGGNFIPAATFAMLVQTAEERTRLQPLLAACIKWYGLVNQKHQGEDVGEALTEALTDLYTLIQNEILSQAVDVTTGKKQT